MKRAGNNRSHITQVIFPIWQLQKKAAAISHNGGNLKCVKRMCARDSIMHGKRVTNEYKYTHSNMNTSSGFFHLLLV